MEYSPLYPQDISLIEAAADVIRRNYVEGRPTAGAALRGASGWIYTGVNIESCADGPCAEPIALGAGIYHQRSRQWGIFCRTAYLRKLQMLVVFAPDILVILELVGQRVKTAARVLHPTACRGFAEG